MKWLVAACGSCLLFFAAALGTFVPLGSAHGQLEYLFAGPPIAKLLQVCGLSAAILVSTYAIVVLLAKAGSDAARARSGRWLSAFTPVGAVAIGILPAAPGFGERASVVAYFLYDLRWWWLVAAIAVAALRAHQVLGSPAKRISAIVSRWSPPARLLFQDASLFTVVTAWAIVTLPMIRFESALHGDEPKYVRFCENWYQGGGLDVSHMTPLVDVPPNEQPAVLRNVWSAVSVLPAEAQSLARDLRDFARDPWHFRWNRVQSKNAFISGKNGGVYQLHQPGVSLVLFPGYFLDRYLLTTDTRADGRSPLRLPMTNAAMLLTYGACAIALFRFLKNALQSDALGWFWSAAAMLTLPTTSFAFQLYPELPALFLVLAVSNYLLFGERARAFPATAAGLAGGALVWMHVRFLMVIAVFVAAAIGTRRKAARWMFVGGAAAMVLTELAYEYHVTGSWLPSARYDADNQGVSFFRMRFVLNALGYFFDRMWGLLPHALLMIGALPGLVLLAREAPRRALFVSASALALIITAAGHSLSGAGTTPGRLIVAIVPLLIWPVAVFVRRVWASDVWRAILLLTGVLSLHAAFAYNFNHDKSTAPMFDVSFSGWKPNLAFPIITDLFETGRANITLFCVWLAIVILAAVLAVRRRAVPSQRTRPWLVPLTLVAFIAFFTVTTAANGDWTRDDYTIVELASRETAARALIALDRCRVCFSTDQGQTDWIRFGSSDATSGHANLTQDKRTVEVYVALDGADGGLKFGRATIAFGDGSAPENVGVMWDRTVQHRYNAPGTYVVVVTLQLPLQTITVLNERIDIQ